MWPRSLDAMLAQLLSQGRPVNSQDLGCRGPVAPAFLEDGEDRRLGELEELFIERPVRPGVLPKRSSRPGRELAADFAGFEAGAGLGSTRAVGKCSGRIG